MGYYFFYVLLVLSNCSQKGKEYAYEVQASKGKYFINTEWHLDLTSASVFYYRIAEFNSQKAHLGIKSDTTLYTGTWRFSKDTLVLLGHDIEKNCKLGQKFIRKSDKLIPVDYCIDSMGKKYKIPFLLELK